MKSYSEKELAVITEMLVEQTKKAQQVAKSRGYTKDPRIIRANLK